jgi:hypothetical protein
VDPGLLGASGEIEADRVIVVGKAIELEPQDVGRDRGGGLDGHAADGPERIGNAGVLGGFGEIAIGARPRDRGAAHRGDADRRRVGAAEELDRGRRQFGGAAVARDQFDRIEGAPVAGDAAIGAGAAVEILVGKARNMPRGVLPQIGDGREAPSQPQFLGRTGRAGAERTDDPRVVHASPRAL